jgi:beta-lactamase superfamily II metal-dependent hydrolase
MVNIHVLNVLHGDSLVVEIKENDQTIWGVIDCHNPSPGRDSPSLSFLKSQHVEVLKFVCLTHPHEDHCSGLKQLVEYFTIGSRRIEEYWDFGLDLDKYLSQINTEKDAKLLYELYAYLSNLIERRVLEYFTITERSVPYQGSHVTVRALSPLGRDLNTYANQAAQKLKEESDGKTMSVDKNLLSIVLELSEHDTNVLLTSDAIRQSLKSILERWKKFCRQKGFSEKFIFVKVPHHGSKHSNYEGLWKNFSFPNLSSAAISAGGRYGLPDKETIDSMLDWKVNIYCTNSCGSLTTGRLRKAVLKSSRISPILLDGLSEISEPLEDETSVSPLHGQIVLSSDGISPAKISTEFQQPPITAL